MRYIGIRDEEIPEYCGVTDIAQMMEVHANTVRTWLKSGRLPVEQVKGGMRISRSAIIGFMHEMRMTAARKLSVLTAKELQASVGAMSKLLEVGVSDIDLALEELEECHHVTATPDHDYKDHKIWVHRGIDPVDSTAKVIKRMLSDEHHRRSCPMCGRKLPRVLRAASEPRPEHAWMISGLVEVDKYPELRIGAWSHWCAGCNGIARFLEVSRSHIGVVIEFLRVREIAGDVVLFPRDRWRSDGAFIWVGEVTKAGVRLLLENTNERDDGPGSAVSASIQTDGISSLRVYSRFHIQRIKEDWRSAYEKARILNEGNQ